MTFLTDERLKSYLDTNQLQRERLCLSLLSLDGRFSDVRPRHPRGGPDGGRDIEAVFKAQQKAFGAVGFVNQANDSHEQKKRIFEKFADDAQAAVGANAGVQVFIFFTNLNLTIAEKDAMILTAMEFGLSYCEIFDRERMRIYLDSPDGFSTRFQFLGLPLSEAEQATFFAKWGDDIQSLVSSGFRRLEKTLDRILFLQESSRVLGYFSVILQLDRKYDGDEIGHFRAFCHMFLKAPQHSIWEILFGAADGSERFRTDIIGPHVFRGKGIKAGMGSGQWEGYISDGDEGFCDEGEQGALGNRLVPVGWSSGVGIAEPEFITIKYSHDGGLIRTKPRMSLADIDQAMFAIMVNRSVAERIVAFHVISDGYKIMEVGKKDLYIESISGAGVPVVFSPLELEDEWVVLRPKGGSAHWISYSNKTPVRLYSSPKTPNTVTRWVPVEED